MPLNALTSAPSSTGKDWLTASRKDLMAHIVQRHHAYTRQALTRLGPLLRETLEEMGSSQPELIQVTVFFRELEQDLLAHFRMEENNLFPAILAMEEGGPTPIALSTPKEQMQTIAAEHQAVEELFLNIRMVTSDYELPPEAGANLVALYGGLRDLEDDLHMHLYLENHLLFPRVLPGETL